MRSFCSVIAAVAIVLLGVKSSYAQGRAASVLVEAVDIRATSDTAPVIGQLVASTQADVASRRPGVAMEVLFKAGDHVEIGAPLVRMETDLQQIEQSSGEAALEVAEAGVAAAKARLALALQGLKRQERL